MEHGLPELARRRHPGRLRRGDPDPVRRRPPDWCTLRILCVQRVRERPAHDRGPGQPLLPQHRLAQLAGRRMARGPGDRGRRVLLSDSRWAGMRVIDAGRGRVCRAPGRGCGRDRGGPGAHTDRRGRRDGRADPARESLGHVVRICGRRAGGRRERRAAHRDPGRGECVHGGGAAARRGVAPDPRSGSPYLGSRVGRWYRRSRIGSPARCGRRTGGRCDSHRRSQPGTRPRRRVRGSTSLRRAPRRLGIP